MADIARVSDLLIELEGIGALRAQMQSLVRDEIASLLVEPLQSLVAELCAKDDTLSEDDRQVLASVKQRLAAAIPADQAVEDVSNAAGAVVRKAVAKARGPLRDLRGWIAGRESAAEPIVVEDHGTKSKQ
jgi:hypothetical protein